MIKYLYEIAQWALQVSALKGIYEDKNITVHFIRNFNDTGDLFKDGSTATSPMYFLLTPKSIPALKGFLEARYPAHASNTEALILDIESKALAPAKAKAPVTQELPPVTARDTADKEFLQAMLQELKPMLETTPEEKPAIDPEVKKLREDRFKRYNPNKSFEDEYNWVPAVFNALYFITSPIVAGVGALFFYTKIQSLWLFAAVAIAFVLLELVFRRTIVRKCVSAMMRGRYLFGTVCLVIAVGISAWSIIALWHGANQAEAWKGSVFKSSPVEDKVASLSDSLTLWRAQQKELDGKWGVSLHISKDLSNRIAEGDKQLQVLTQQNDSQNTAGTAVWRYFFLLIEVIVVLALIMPVWYEVRCVLLLLEA